jgi:uncharacterized membrane protein
MTILDILMRYVHISSAILAVGGMAYILVCLWPSMRLVDDTFRAAILELTGRRFSRLLHVAIAGMLISGIYNWIRLAGVYLDMGPIGNALIGTKVLVAMIMFVIAWGRALKLIKGGRPRMWLMINLHLGAVVILLGAVLRYYRLDHLRDAAAAVQATLGG